MPPSLTQQRMEICFPERMDQRDSGGSTPGILGTRDQSLKLEIWWTDETLNALPPLDASQDSGIPAGIPHPTKGKKLADSSLGNLSDGPKRI